MSGMTEWFVHENFLRRRARIHQTGCSFIKPFNGRVDQTYNGRWTRFNSHEGARRYIHDLKFGDTDNCYHCIEPPVAPEVIEPPEEKNLPATKDDIHRLEVPIATTVVSVTRLTERMGYVEDRLANLDDGVNSIRDRLNDIECKLELIIEALGLSSDQLGDRRE